MTDILSKDTFQIPNSDRIAPSGTLPFSPEGEQVDFRKADPELMSIAELNRLAESIAKSKDAPMVFQRERIEFGGTVLTLAERPDVSTTDAKETIELSELELALQLSVAVVAFRTAEGGSADIPREQ